MPQIQTNSILLENGPEMNICHVFWACAVFGRLAVS